MAVDVSPLQKGVAQHHLVKLFRRDEVILAPMLFLPAWWTCGVRNSRLNPRIDLHQRFDQARLTCATRGGNYK